MHTPLHKLIAASAVAIALLGLTACGGGGEAGKTIAVVGKTKITRGTLNHWMSTMIGGDYSELTGVSAPVGLVSEPANYPGCVAAAKRIVPKPGGAPRLSEAALRVKCRQLQRAVKEQALSYLITVLWRAEEGAQLGAGVSDREISSELQGLIYQNYSSPAQFRRFLAGRHWSVADERFLLKRNLLDTKFLARLKQRTKALGGGEQTLAKLIREDVAKWSAQTRCSPGYTAWQCRHSGVESEASPSAAVLVEELSRGVS